MEGKRSFGEACLPLPVFSLMKPWSSSKESPQNVVGKPSTPAWQKDVILTSPEVISLRGFVCATFEIQVGGSCHHWDENNNPEGHLSALQKRPPAPSQSLVSDSESGLRVSDATQLSFLSFCDESLSAESYAEEAQGACYLKCKDRPFSSSKRLVIITSYKKHRDFLPSHLWVGVSSR